MRKAAFLLCPLLLTACTGNGTAVVTSPRWEDLLKNPLYAERYWDDLTDRVTDMQMREKDALKDPRMVALLDEVRRNALSRAQEAAAKKREGTTGQFAGIAADTLGWALLTKDALYLSSDFLTYPGPSLKIYLTTVVDPRNAAFPDRTSIEVGRLESPYGAQQYALPPAARAAKGLRTVVLYDGKLQRIYAFAQLQ